MSSFSDPQAASEPEKEQEQKKKVLPFQLGDVSEANVQQIRILSLKTLPVRYSEKFYKELTIKYDKKYMKYAFYNGFAVGSVCARVEPMQPLIEEGDTSTSTPDIPEQMKLYIMIINVLGAYRRLGIASELLKYVLDTAKEDPDVVEAYLHVQINNEDAKNFYLMHGFEQVKIIKGYYKNIEPSDCYLFRKALKHLL